MEFFIWTLIIESVVAILLCGVMIYCFSSLLKLFTKRREEEAKLYEEELREIDELMQYPSLTNEGRIQLTLRRFAVQRQLISYQKTFKKGQPSQDEK